MSGRRSSLLRRVARLQEQVVAPWIEFKRRLSTASCETGPHFWAADRIVVRNRGSISIGPYCALRGPGPVLAEFRCAEGARIHIGTHTYMNWGILIDAHHEIVIGRDCMVASQVIICDKRPYREGAIHIENNVWIAHAAVIEPGVRIGENSVIGAKAVVCNDVPPNSLAMGNPARCVPLTLVAR